MKNILFSSIVFLTLGAAAQTTELTLGDGLVLISEAKTKDINFETACVIATQRAEANVLVNCRKKSFETAVNIIISKPCSEIDVKPESNWFSEKAASVQALGNCK